MMKQLIKLIYSLAVALSVSSCPKSYIRQSWASESNFDKDTILEITKKDFILGCDNAPNIIIEYSSFVCPHCAEFHAQSFRELEKKYIDTCKVKYVHRDFPTSPAALFASMLAHCSDDYLSSAEMLFSSQGGWAFSHNYKEGLITMFKLRGMTDDTIKKCGENKELNKYITTVAYQAVKGLEINYTPTFFVNGEKIQGKLDIDKLKLKGSAQLAKSADKIKNRRSSRKP